jgi:hypothetical protein
VPDVDEQITRPDLTTAAESLRRVLAAIDTGEITADLDHVAYLRGAVDALEVLAGGCPDTKVTGHPASQETGVAFPQDS